MTTDIVPRTLVVERELDRNEPMYLTLLSDLHLESAGCDTDGLRSLLKERAKLGDQHSAVAIGDVMDLIGGMDPRSKPSVQAKILHGLDDWVGGGIDHAVKVMAVPGIKWDMVSVGNHESGFLRHNGFDVTSVLANRIGAARGGYSGVVDYRLLVHSGPSKTVTKTRFRLLYHHGNWLGRVAKGAIGAQAYFSQWDNWNLAVYGHSHGGVCHADTRVEVRHDGSLREYTTYTVNASSWVKAYNPDDARDVTFAEKRGMLRNPRLSPLVTVIPQWHGPKANLLSISVSVTMGGVGVV